MEYKVSNSDYLSINAMRAIGRQCAELVGAVETIQKALKNEHAISFIYGPESVGVTIVRHGYASISYEDEPEVLISSSKDGRIWVVVPTSLLGGAHFSRLVPSFLVDAIDAAGTREDRVSLIELCFGHVSSHFFAEIVSGPKAPEFNQVNDFSAAPPSSCLDTLIHATTRSIHEMDVPRIDIRALFAWHILNRGQSSAGTKDAFEEPDDAT